MANATSFHLDENVIRFRQRTRNILDREGLLEIMQDGGPHGLCLNANNIAREAFHSCLMPIRGKGEMQDGRKTPLRSTAYDCTPFRKNSSALRTRSLRLCGSERSTAHRRTTVV